MRNSVRRATLVLALTPLVSLPAATAFAAATGSGSTGTGTTTTTITTPAPSGDAWAVGAEVNGVIAIGKTKAHAGSDGGAANADGLDILGQRIAGGDQTGVGSKNGNLIGTGDTPIGDAELAPWSAKVGSDNGGYQSMAEAALAHVSVTGVAELWVLHSKSSATWTPGTSTGDSQSDGAEVSALGLLDVKVLHSEAHSTGKSKSDLLVVNGTEIGSSDDANGMCKLDVPGVVDLICLTASGGTSSTGVTSSQGTVAGVDVGGGGIVGTVSGSTSAGGKAGTPAPKVLHRTKHRTLNGPLPHTGPETANLPFTGSDVTRMGSIAVALAALGGAMTAFGRRRRVGSPA